MKYTIEKTEQGCCEILEFGNGKKYQKRSKEKIYGCEPVDKEFYCQLEEDGFCEEMISRVKEMFDGFGAMNFLELDDMNEFK